MIQVLKNRIENDFSYHQPTPSMVPKFNAIRSQAKNLALMIADLVPKGREQSTALTRLEEVVMHSNAGIARRPEDYPEDAEEAPELVKEFSVPTKIEE